MASTADPADTPARTSIAVSPASTKPSPPGVTGICARICAAQNASSTSDGRGRHGADGRQRGEQRRVVERPAPAGRGQRALPARPERADDACRGRPAGAPAARSAAPNGAAAGCGLVWITRPTHLSAPVEDDQHGPDGEQRHEDDDADGRRLEQAAGSTPPRRIAGIARIGIASTTAKTSRFVAVSPATARRPGRPAWTSMRYWSAAPSAPPPGAILASALPASGQLTTARNAGPLIREVLERPQARERAVPAAPAIKAEPAPREATNRGRPTSP